MLLIRKNDNWKIKKDFLDFLILDIMLVPTFVSVSLVPLEFCRLRDYLHISSIYIIQVLSSSA